MSMVLRGKLQLEKLEKDFERKAKAGLFFASEHVYSETDVIIPVDHSILKNSKFTPVIKERGGVFTSMIGYTADYAFWVHEMPADTNWKKSGAQNKFLERTMKSESREILRIIGSTIKR